MEFVDGGSILDKIKKQSKPLNEEQIAYVVHEVLLGLDYLSRSNKIHRDIKAANSTMNNKEANQWAARDVRCCGSIAWRFSALCCVGCALLLPSSTVLLSRSGQVKLVSDAPHTLHAFVNALFGHGRSDSCEFTIADTPLFSFSSFSFLQADFGATAQLTDTMTKCSTFVGSPYWMVRWTGGMCESTARVLARSLAGLVD